MKYPFRIETSYKSFVGDEKFNTTKDKAYLEQEGFMDCIMENCMAFECNTGFCKRIENGNK